MTSCRCDSSESSHSGDSSPDGGRGGGDGHLANFLFATAARQPGSVCVEEEEVHLTYAELAELAVTLQEGLHEVLARGGRTRQQPEDELRPPAHGRRSDEDIINVVLKRGALSIAAVHAVMLEGKAYNVFDLGNRREVLAAQLEVSRPPVVISSAAVASTFSMDSLLPQHTALLDAEMLVRDKHKALPRPIQPLDDAALARAGDRLAYVIFTSGSTGKPKAVMIEHSSACNQVRVFGEMYGIQGRDRVAQEFSMSFDPHVIEVFVALRWGATLVIMADEVKHSGPDMLPWIQEERISVLTMTPSGFRMMMSNDADVSRQGLPDLRICGSGGEALGRDVLDSWAVGRRFFNLYGPTETSVTSVAALLRPGDPIVIGHSLATYHNAVLDQDTLQPLARGEHGVLFTAGPGVGRGYLDEEKKTKDRFLEVPGLGRAYNTGDIVFQDAAGDFHWIGRADFQAKVRGNRIELENLEHAINSVPGVKYCEARVVGNGTRLALLASGEGFTEEALHQAAIRLGHAYKLNTVKIVDASAWSFSVNGKLLRNTVPLEEEAPAEETPTALQRRLSSRELRTMSTADVAAEVARHLGVPLQSPEDDFFACGGTSVTAAKFVTKLRELASQEEELRRLRGAAVRDLYESRTMKAFAELIDARVSRSFSRAISRMATLQSLTDRESLEVIGTERFYLVSLLQLLWLIVEFTLLFMGIVKLMHLFGSVSLTRFEWAAVGVGLAFFLVPGLILAQSLLIGLVKLLLCFRASEGAIQLWSLHYFRWWVVHHMQDMIPTTLLSGTPYAAWWAWLMGAKVGRGVVLWQVPRNADLELLDLGDGASLGQESFFNTAHVEKGVLFLGPIKVGAGASIGCRVNVAHGAVVEEGAVVEDLTYVSGRYAAVPEAMSESESEDLEASSCSSSGEDQTAKSKDLRGGFGWFVGLAMLPGMGITLSLYSFALPLGTIFLLLIKTLAEWIMGFPPLVAFWLQIVILAVLSQLLAVLYVILLKWLLVGRLESGSFKVSSLKYWRFWFMQQLVGFAGGWLPLTLQTIYLPMMLRCLGARVGEAGRDFPELGAFIYGYTPDVLELGDGATLADRCSVGGIRIRRGRCELQPTNIGDNSFIGNLSVVRAGSALQQDVLVGIMSLAPREAEPGTRWLGVPPIELPPQAQVVASMSRRKLSLEPSCLTFVGRVIFDFLRGQLTFCVLSLFFTGFQFGPKIMVTRLAYEKDPGLEAKFAEWAKGRGIAWFWVWDYRIGPEAEMLHVHYDFLYWIGVGLWGVLCMLALVLGVVLLKWLGQCRVRPGAHSMPSCRVLMSGYFLALQTAASPILTMLFGTPFACLYYRLLGARVGRRCFVSTLYVAEPDLVSLGDGACLNSRSTLGTHTFENRVYRVGRVTLEESAALGCEAAVLRGATLRARAVLEASALCLADEELLRGRHKGCPCSRSA